MQTNALLSLHCARFSFDGLRGGEGGEEKGRYPMFVALRSGISPRPDDVEPGSAFRDHGKSRANYKVAQQHSE